MFLSAFFQKVSLLQNKTSMMFSTKKSLRTDIPTQRNNSIEVKSLLRHTLSQQNNIRHHQFLSQLMLCKTFPELNAFVLFRQHYDCSFIGSTFTITIFGHQQPSARFFARKNFLTLGFTYIEIFSLSFV